MSLLYNRSYELWVRIRAVRRYYMDSPNGMVIHADSNRDLPAAIQTALAEMVQLMRGELDAANANGQTIDPQLTRWLAVLDYHNRHPRSILPKDPVTLAAIKAGLERMEAAYQRYQRLERCKI